MELVRGSDSSKFSNTYCIPCRSVGGTSDPIPDIMCYCCSLTRDAPYLNLPGGDTLNDMEPARLLRTFQLTVGVVDGTTNEGIGQIAVAPAGRAKWPIKGTLFV